MKLTHSFLALLAIILTFSQCTVDDPSPIGEPSDKLEGINDEFELQQVIFYDNLTPFDDNSVDVSETFIGETPMTLQFDAQSLSYTVDAGTSLNFFGEGGSWSFDNNQFPTYIDFESNGSNELLRTNLLRTIRTQDDQLQLSLGGKCDESAVTYEMYFNRK